MRDREPDWVLRLDKLTPPSEMLPNNRLRVRSRGAHIVSRQIAGKYRGDIADLARAARNRAGLSAPLYPGRVRVRATIAWEKYLAIGKKRMRRQYRSHPDGDGLDEALKRCARLDISDIMTT